MIATFKKLSLHWKIVVLVTIVLLSATTTSVFARNPIPQPVPTGFSYGKHVFEPAVQSQDVNLQSTVYEIYLSMLEAMARTPLACDHPTGSCHVPYQTTQAEGTVYYSGIIPVLSGYNNSMLTSPVISHKEYIASVGTKLNIIQPAYAQGLGYEGLRPALKIWQAFRNIAYLLATIGFIILSFMVMFRVKISSQAVLTAQSAIIKLVVVILAITFSYAIAGFIVDLIYLFSSLIITLFISTGLITTPSLDVQRTLFSANIFTLFGALVGTSDEAGNAVQSLVADVLGIAQTSFIDVLWDWVFGEGIDVIIRIVVGIAILYSLFKLFVQLIFAYLEIILLTIMSPIMILPDILPGGNAFYTWMRRIFANAMVFPTVTFMFLVGMAMVGGQNSFNIDGEQISGWTGNGDAFQGIQIPYMGIATEHFPVLLGIGIILLTPKVVDMVKNALKVPGFTYMSAIGQSLGVGAAGASRVMSPITYTAREAGLFGSDLALRKATAMASGSGPIEGGLRRIQRGIAKQRTFR